MAPDFAAREVRGVSLARFVHSGDWQLGMKRRFLGEEAQARFDEARFEAIRRIGRVAHEESCEFVVVLGVGIFRRLDDVLIFDGLGLSFFDFVGGLEGEFVVVFDLQLLFG